MCTRVAQVLREARRLVEPEDQWCRDAPALDRHGAIVRPTDPEAVRWDATGALDRVLWEARADHETQLAAHRALGRESSWRESRTATRAVNDELGHAAVLARFDRAIREVA